MRRWVAVAALLLSLGTGPARAGDVDDCGNWPGAIASTTVSTCRKLAAQGDPLAQFNLGLIYELGQDVPQDLRAAFGWYKRAAESGYAPGQYKLGIMYSAGLGVPQNFALAAKWERAAAEQGNPGSQVLLGLMYSDGQGVPRDLVKAHMWLNLASSLGAPDGPHFRDEVAAKMTPSQIEKAQALAAAWKPTKGQ